MFVTFEGGEGAGKSTQITRLAERLQELGKTVIVTREPGGTPAAESIRDVLLSGRAARFGPDAESLLFAVARTDHVETLIAPAIAAGRWVLCDRFFDSTRAYQGASDGVSDTELTRLEQLAVGATRPDLTLILDVPADTGLARAHARRNDGTSHTDDPDRFEREDLVVHETRRNAFLKIAENEPDRCVVIDANADEAKVAERIWRAVQERLLR